jgi:hypothetical protein
METPPSDGHVAMSPNDFYQRAQREKLDYLLGVVQGA